MSTSDEGSGARRAIFGSHQTLADSAFGNRNGESEMDESEMFPFAPFHRLAVSPIRRQLSGLRGFHFFGVFAEPRFAVAPRTMMERRLSSTDVCCVPFPGFQDRSLQGTPVGKA